MKLKQRGASFASLLVGLALIGGLVWAFFNWQLLYDSARLIGYQPSSEVAAVAERTTMTDKAKRLFYASDPQIGDGAEFRQHCLDHETGGAVLGCYHQQQIYIYNVDNPELAGIEEVTAAHEMLHAAYVRLDTTERQYVDELLRQQTKTLQGNAKFKKRLSVYNQLSQEERLNELHSILATEHAELSPQLKEYYQQYFGDRSQVIDLYKQYSAVFEQLKSEAENLAASLDAQAATINQRVAAYEAANQRLSQRVVAFNQRANTPNGFSSQAEFEATRQALVAESNRLENERQAINQLVAAYNQDKQRYEAIATHLSQLNNSIDSSLEAPAEVQ